MKYLISFLAIALSLPSCKKESIEIKKIEFTVHPSDWYAFGNSYGYEANIPEITEDVITNASITSYYSLNPNLGWTTLPYVSAPGFASVRVGYSKSQVSLGYYDLDLTTDAPANDITFKIVITKNK